MRQVLHYQIRGSNLPESATLPSSTQSCSERKSKVISGACSGSSAVGVGRAASCWLAKVEAYRAACSRAAFTARVRYSTRPCR
jgi:hypothetical protein